MRLKKNSGFTIVELIVAFAIVGILMSIGMVSIPKFKSQMKVSEEIRRLALTINSLRNEAIRQRTNVRLTFSSSGYSWDINNNGTTDGTYTFENGSSWSGATPAGLTINGLGLMRGISSTQNFNIKNYGKTLTLTVNTNGFVTF